MTVTIRHGDCREILRMMPDESVHCVVTKDLEAENQRLRKELEYLRQYR